MPRTAKIPAKPAAPVVTKTPKIETTEARRERRLRYEAAARQLASEIVDTLVAAKLPAHPLDAAKTLGGLHVHVAANRQITVVAIGSKADALLARASKLLAKTYAIELTADDVLRVRKSTIG